MKIRAGDLIQLALEKEFDLITHGCNCHCTMAAGIAKKISKTFPDAYHADCTTVKGDHGKLGTISLATVVRDGHEIIIVNSYTQYNWSGSGVLVDYQAVRSCMQAIAELFPTKRIGYPKIGAGLAGGDWPTIAEVIDKELWGIDHTLVTYTQAIRRG